ncbi:MAG: efflux RND transporter periplasmic adaptor subunit [Sphingomonadales bacterium]|nr:efflux RND transporter periplasmic adaptor subunit [Sphingomonadales bacterium]MBD3774034.1 efflux RND transporter periplasmic adaptor subunit [Paracoccaceae bacterium]
MNYEATLSADGGEVLTEDAVYADEAGAAPKGGRKLIVILIIAAVIAAVGLLYYFTHGSEDKPFAPTKDVQVPVVSVIAPGRTTIEGEIETTGTLAARRPMPVGSVGEGGRVVAVPVDAGDWVNQGQLLVSIDRSVQVQQIASARASVSVAEADAQLAQANLDRALKLVARGFVSQADVDRLTATRDAARARVQVARAQLGELQARTARLNIYAPASGLVLDRSVEVGQTVAGGGTPVFTIARGGEMELLAKVNEEELSRLSPGVQASVTPVGSDKSFSGQVWQISPMIDQQSRQGTARIALSYAPGLRPGGFAKVTIASGQVVAPMLPESAIQTDENGAFVMIVGKDNKVVRRNVKTGLVTEKGIVVREGLTGNEHVVLRAAGFLNPGDKVEPHLVKTGK